MNVPTYTFVSVVRSGLCAAIDDVDTFDASNKGRATFTASFSVTGNVTTPAPVVSVPVRLHGPSDVTGIDSRQVIRTEPKALTQNYEPNFFAAVEFDRADFPWMLMPAHETDFVPNVTDPTTASSRLRPWIVLVAVRRQDGVTLAMQQGQSLPVLQIDSPAVVTDELQDLTDSWAWAHAQTVGDETEVGGALSPDNPAHNSSRLICPRRLHPLESYIACVVPAFKLGVTAGLGNTVSPDDEKALDPAWSPSDTSVKLPVYFHFEFNTGPNGDFEALADLLVPTSLTADDVTVPFDVAGDPRLPEVATPVRLDGALTAGEPPAFDDNAYQTVLATIINQAPPSLNPNDPDPIVAPPIYGRWHAAKDSVAPGDGWLADLNLDPRRRVAAGLGTRVVQEQQEQLMASAWSQLGEVQAANALLRRAQLAREAMAAAHAKTVARLASSTDRRYGVIGPALSRLLGDPGTTLAGATLAAGLRTSRVPTGVTASPFRKLLRPRGAVGNRLFSSVPATPTPVAFPSIIEGINAVTLAVIPTRQLNGIVLGTQPAGSGGSPVFGDSTIQLPPPASDTTLRDTTVNVTKFQTASVAVGSFLGVLKGTLANQIQLPSSRPQLDLTQSGINKIHPSITIPARVLGRISINGSAIGPRASLPDPLQPIMAAPQFPQPMYAPLRDLSPEFLLPGLFRIPPNTVTLLDTNRQFIEAYLAGLNHEVARELLWRGYPTDQRGTYFAQFWDNSSRVPASTVKDITQMHTWTAQSRLGDHEPVDPNRTSGDEVVLVIRGELLRRYPNTIIYAAPAKLDAQGNFLDLDETKEEIPIFRGTIPPDVTFLGFNLTDSDVRTRQLYFVLQEQPTEPRFGLNEVPASDIDPTAALQSWGDLAWGHFGDDVKFITVGTLPNASSLPTNPVWGVNGAHMAQITLQTPVRVAIFGPDILPKVGP